MELNKNLELDENQFDDIDSESSNDAHTSSEPIKYTVGNPQAPLNLKFQNQFFDISVNGYTEQSTWELFCGVLNHPVISKSNEFCFENVAKELKGKPEVPIKSKRSSYLD